MSIGGEAMFQAGYDGAELSQSQALIDLLTAGMRVTHLKGSGSTVTPSAA